jgi:hypothetical protein
VPGLRDAQPLRSQCLVIRSDTAIEAGRLPCMVATAYAPYVLGVETQGIMRPFDGDDVIDLVGGDDSFVIVLAVLTDPVLW